MENYVYAVWIFVIQVTIRMRGASKSPRQVAMIAYPCVVKREWFFAHMAVLSNFCQSSRVKSGMGTLVDKTVFTLCAKFQSSSTNHLNRYCDENNIYFDSESSMRVVLNTLCCWYICVDLFGSFSIFSNVARSA